MANWEMDSANVIDYSPNGDDIDRFSLKVKNNFEHIFTLLQLLHSNGATAGLNNDATSYEIRVDSSTDAMYIRNNNNTDWVFLGEVKENFGIKPETIGAVENGGGTGKLFTGTESAMADIPADSLETHDFYFAYDTTRLFTWTGTDWVIFLSRQFGDMLNYEKYCVAKAEVAYNGANKILRLDEETGKGNIDITGSPNRIWDKEIDLQDLQNNHVLTFNAEKNKWVNLPKDELFRKDLTYAGEAGKIVVVGEDGTIHANLTGSASKIDGITVDADGIEDKQILAYDFVHKAFVPVKKDLFDESSVTTEGMAGKLVRVHADGTIHADITGSTSQIAGLDVDISNRNVGYVLSISSTGTLKFIKVFNEDDVTTTGETGKLVRVADDGTIKGKIAGSATELSGVKIDTTNMKDGYVPVYNVESDTFIFKPKDEVAKTTSTETGEIGKNIIVSEDGTAHINITGSASAVDGVDVEISDLQDGDVLVYHVSTGTLRNEPKNTVGTGKSLILKDGAKVLGDYNGANTTVVDVAEVIENSNIKYVNHVMRMLENIHLTMDIAGLNPGGYDNVATEIFKGTEKNIDNTQVNVTSAIVGDDSIDVATIEGLIVGGNYELTDGANLENVRIKDIRIVGDTKRVILYNDIVNSFNMANTILRRSNATVGEGFVGGDGVMFVTNLIPFTNEMTGEGIKMSRAHLTVKHQNVADAEIKAEVAFIKNPVHVVGEVIGIGNGSQQTVVLANPEKVGTYGFNLYFDGVKQTSGFIFSPGDANVTFAAANNVVVSADYFYNWTAENFVEMTKTGTYPDKKNSSRASSQYLYRASSDDFAGNVAVLKFSLKQLSGGVSNFMLGSGTGNPQGFKLQHQAIAGSIAVTPSTATWTYKEDVNTIIINAALNVKCKKK